MNKIFKVVWSKTKECYVVVSEVAKNNGGKKKVLASVLAGLAMIGAGTMGTPVQAGTDLGNSSVNISPNGTYNGSNTVGKNSVAVGYQNTTSNEEGTIAIGMTNTATENSSLAIGNVNTASGGAAVAIGTKTKASGAASVALGNLSQATNKGAIAIGTRTNYETTNTTTGAGYGLTAGEYSTTVGGWSRATGQHSSAFGYNNKVTGDHSTAVGTGNTIDGTQVAGAVAVGNKNNASGDRAIAIGETNTSKVEDTITMGTSNTASTGGGIAIGKNNLADSTNRGTKTDGGRANENSQIAIGRDNEATHIDTVAVGREVKSTGTGAVGLGSRINATGDYAVAIGNSSAGGTVEAADYAVAVGFKAKATGGRSIAQGGAATAAAERSIAMGLKSNVTAQKANSTYSYSGTGGAIVGGVNTSTKTIHSAAGKDGANDIYGSGDGIAIGPSASVSDESNAAVVIGKGAKTEGNAHYSVVVGKESYANASDGVVVGQNSYVKARESVAIGQGANVSNAGNVRSQAIGFGATVSGTTAYDALAIGSGAQVTDVTAGVALGSGSEVARKTSDNENAGWNSKSLNGTVIRNRAYTADLTGHGDQWDSGRINTGAVSVGNDTQKRQIINVAAGNKDTDAVNVAQLKNVGVRVGADTNTATITVGTNTSNVAADFLAYNGQLNIKGDNNRVTTVSENDANGKDANVNVKFDYDGLVKAKAGSSVTVNQKTEGGKTVFEIDAAAGGATSTEKVQAKADVAGSSDKNIAKVAPKAGENFGDVGATYEVNVSRNDVKDAAREAVTVNNGGTTKADGSYTADSNNPISVTPTKDDTNHNTSYAVTFDGNKAAKQIPLTYKANGNGAKTVTLEKGLDFTNGTNTTAEIGNDGVVKYNLNKDVDLSNTGSLTVGDTTVNNGSITIKAPTPAAGTTATTTDVKLTNTGLDNGGNKITNVAEGTNNTDAVNVKQLKENRTEVKAGANVVVTTDVDATDNHTIYTVNAVTPAVYTTPDGEKLTKDKDGKFHKVGETAEYTGDIITSFENPKAAAGQTTKDGGMIVNNVGSAIKNQTGATYLDKLKAAADANSNVKNAVVNVSDLKNTSDAIIDKGLRFDANEGNEKTNKLGSKVTVQGTGTLTAGKAYADEYNTANIRTKIDQDSDGNTTINVGLAKALKDINSISNGASSITLNSTPGGATNTPAVQITGGNLSMGDGTTNNKIVNLAPGTDGTDAVNLNQLKGMRTVVTSTDKSVTVTSNENSTTGQVTYDLKVSTTGTVAKSTWNLNSGVVSATEGTHTGDTTQNIADTKTVTMQAGKNLTVTQTNDTAGNASVAYSLDKDISVETVTVTGQNGKDGKIGIDGKDGVDGKDGKNRVEITVEKGAKGVDGTDGHDGINGHNGKDGMTRIVYEDKGGKQEVATLNDGLKFTGNNESTENNHKLNTLVKVQGEGTKEGTDATGTKEIQTSDGTKFKSAADNIAVEADGNDKLTVKLSKNLKGLDSVTTKEIKLGDANDNISIKKDGDRITYTTNNGGTTTTNKVANLADEKHITQGSYTVGDKTIDTNAANDEVTLTYTDGNGNLVKDPANNPIMTKIKGVANSDLSNITETGTKNITKLGSIVKAGDNVTVTSTSDTKTGQTTYTVNAVTPAVYTTPDGEKLTKDKDGKFHKVGETAEYTGDIITSFENPKAAAGQTTKDGGMIVNNVGSAIKNQTPTMPAGQTATYLDKLKAAADAGSNVKNAAVNVSDLHNTAEALKASELHIAPTVGGKDADKGGTAVTPSATATAAGAATQAYKYNATTKQVELTFNDGNGKAVTGPKAVIDLSDLANQITSGYTFSANATANGGTVANDAATPAVATAVENGGTINYAAGKNLTVKQDIDTTNKSHTYTYALADEVSVGEKAQPGVPGKDGKDGSIGVTGKDGASVVINGKDGSIGMTGPKGQDGKDGINGRDGANISMTSAKGEQVLINRDPAHNGDTDKAERIVYVPKDASGNPIQDANGKNIVREVATMDDGLKFGGDMGTVNSVKLNKQVDVKGGITDTNKLATGNNIGVTSGIDPTTNNATLNVQLAKDLTGLNSVELGGNTIKTDGDHLTITTPGTTTTNKVANLADEKHITQGNYTVGDKTIDTNAADDEVTLTYTDGNGALVKDTANNPIMTKIKGIAKSDLSNINDAGKKVITGLGTIVKAGDNVTVTSTSDTKTGQTTYTVNAVTPAVYTKADGTKVVKRPDGTFTTNVDGAPGNDVPASDVIVSFQDAAGNRTGGNSIVNNVGSAIDKTGTSTGDTFLTKLDDAATATPNAAVNVKDLKNTSDAIIGKGLKFDANEGGEKTNKLGSKVTVQGTGALSTGKAYADEYNTANIRTNIEQGTDGNTTINVGLAKALKDINSISNGGSSITISDVPAGATTPAVTISGGNLSMGDGTTNNKIVNLAPGTDGTDAVNLNQLKGMRTVVTSTDKSVTVTSNENSTTGQVTYDLKVSTTGTVAKSTWNLNSGVVSATEGTHTGDTTQNIADTKTVTMQAGKNLTVTQTNDTAGNASVAYSLDKEISVETVTVTGQNGKDGKIGIDGKDGVDGKDGKNRVEITVEKGAKGVDGTDGHDGVNGHNGKDGMTRIVYEDKGGKQEVATLNDGLKFTGNNESTENNHKLNTLVKVQGEGTKEGTDATGAKEIQTSDGTKFESAADNIAVEANGTDTLTVKLNKNLKGLNSVTTKEIKLGDANDNISIKKDGDRITYTTNNGGTTTINKVANLADELHIEDKTYTIGDTSKRTNAANDEVTLTYKDGNGAEVAGKYAIIKGVANSDLSNITETGKKNITKLGSIVKAGDNVTVTSTSDTKTGQTTYTVNAVTPAVYTKADGTKVVKRPDGTFTTNVDGAPGNDVPASDVIVSFQDAAGNRTGGNSIVNNVGSAIDKPGTATGNTFLTKLDNAATDTPFAAVNVRDLKTTADALKANELHIAPTSGGTDTDKGGVVKTAGSTDMVYKYDSASKTITLTYNDGNGKAVTGPKAVLDFTDLNIPAGGNNFGFKANATANGGKVANDATTPAAATAVENGGTVNFAAGKNLTVKQDIDATNKTQTYTFSLDKDLTNLDKVVVNGKDGQAGKDGVTIVGPQGATGAPGIPGTNGIDGKVGISGKDGKDAVSIAGKDGVGTIGLTGPQGPAGTNGKSVDISTENGKQTLVKPEANNGNQSQRIVYVPKDANGNPLKDADGNDIKREVATMDDGLRFTGNNTSKENKQPMNSLVKVQGEGVTENAAGKLEANGQEFKSAAGNIAVEADGNNTLTVKMNKDLNLTKDGSVTMGDTVVNNDGITIKAPTTPGTTTTDVKLTNQGLDNGGNKITNVAAGTANTDAVNVKQLKDNVTTVTSSDSSIKVVDKNDPTSATYDATKGHQYDITINNQGVVNNAQTPVVYTKEDGTKVYKQPDGTFNTNINGTGAVVPANQVIASMNSAGNSSTDPTKLQNVGSSIADKTGTTFLDKINTAAGDPNAKYGAVNVTDLKSTSDALIDKGLVFDANNGDPKTNKLGSKVTIAGTGALGTTENFADKYNTDNIRTNIKQDAAGNTTVEIGLNKNLKGLESVSVPGKDGVDGQDGVSITGKDGANGIDGKVSIGKDGKDAVSISGKDGIGHIGLTGPAGKDGKNATADITVKEGKPGVNGTDGITRIVYKDKDGNDHEVATHDDGVKYAGDDAQGTDKTKVISKKLNETIDIVGGADKTKLTDNNIGVNNDGGKLKVQLANELAGINKISNGGSSITFNSNPGGATNTPAVQISGGDLNMGGNKITNLKKGSDVSDAATVGQLTKVKSSNNSVGITESTDANGAKVYDLSVTGVPGADPRVDKLGEEIGRVGAQGAALAALKPIQYDPLEPTQIMAGYGNYRGNSAVALGVAHYKNESTLIHGGISWAGGSSHMMANAGVTWKVGNRDSEAAVADRYRKGPISSAYAMQQEMAAMKAQNAGLKGEVSDLKAENEQMKAQIAAMMAKLGL